jgi:hypothetical protein
MTTTKPTTWPRVLVNSWAEFQIAIEPHLDTNCLFRGVTSVRHSLAPSVGRKRDGFSYSASGEKALFTDFKREALPFLTSRPVDDWEWLALAQHFGTPTRLLDWSESPYVSLFFAVWGNDEEDAGLYIIPRPEQVDRPGTDPFKVEKVCFYYPGYVTARLVSQRGLFTVHPDPTEIYLPANMKQIVLAKSMKADFRRKLDATGVHHAAIFADLDGLSRRLVALQGFRGASAPARPPAAAAPRASAVEKPDDPALTRSKINPLDPQKGQWGRQPVRNGWALSAKVSEIAEGWYRIHLTVQPAKGSQKQLTKAVAFHLHNSFKEPMVKALPHAGAAKIVKAAYGAFTVGAEVLQDGTWLELDLAELSEAPKRFREQ